jgi:hypothetical protein
VSLLGGTQLRLTVCRNDGRPVAPDRAPRVQVRWSSNLASPLSQWAMWPGTLVYTNGVLYGDAAFLRDAPARYFIAVETTVGPPLQVSAASLLSGTQLRLTIRCRDGSPIRTDRIPRIRVSCSPTLDPPPAQWSVWSGTLAYTNGVLYGDAPLPRSEPSRFFTAVEELQ